MKELFSQLLNIIYKVVTLDVSGAASAVKNFKIPKMDEIKMRIVADEKNQKQTKSATDLSKNIIKPDAPTKNIDFGGSKSGKGSGMSGVGGVKTINQKIEIKNYFTVGEGTDVKSIAEHVIRAINDRLRDDTVALQF